MLTLFSNTRDFSNSAGTFFEYHKDLVFFPEHCQDLLFLISQTLIFSNTTDTHFFLTPHTLIFTTPQTLVIWRYHGCNPSQVIDIQSKTHFVQLAYMSFPHASLSRKTIWMQISMNCHIYGRIVVQGTPIQIISKSSCKGSGH